MKITFRCFIAMLLFGYISCEEDDPQGNKICPPSNIVESPYTDPIWHPSGKVIGFNHKPVKEVFYSAGINCPNQATYIFDDGATGFWLINSDGANMRRILPNTLTTPAWSPDGKWIAFSRNAQIYIMPFDGSTFDTSALIQLTSEGRNFFPSWSPDGRSIAYNESICNENIDCGIWIHNLENDESQFIAKYGNYPSWHPRSDSLVYLSNTIDENGVDIGDSLWQYSIPDQNKYLLKTISEPYYENRDLKISSDGTKVALISTLSSGGSGQLYTINLNDFEFYKLTSEGCQGFSWSPEGKIVYVNHDYSGLDEEKGTLWIMNNDGTGKRQLTFNNFEIIQ